MSSFDCYDDFEYDFGGGGSGGFGDLGGQALLVGKGSVPLLGDDTKDENAWAWPDAFGLGCCLAPEPTTPATPGVRFVSKGKRQRVPDASASGR